MATAAVLKIEESLERCTNVGFSALNYCPETVLVHCAFLLAHNEAGQSLVGMKKGTCSQVVHIVCETVREVTTQTRQADHRKFLDAETKELEFKIHSWVFTSLLKSYDTLDPGESLEEDYLDSFPPLPPFDINFYVALVHEIGWADLLVEAIFAIGVENVSSILEDIIKCLVQQPSCKDLLLFHTLFTSLLMMGKENSTSDDHQEIKLDSISASKSWWLLLLCGMANLAKDYLCWPEAQMEVIIKTVTDFTFESFIDLSFKKQNSVNKKGILPNNCLVENSYPCEQQQAHNDKELETERTSGRNMRVIAEEIANSGFFISAEVTAGFDLLCQLTMNDWREPLHWIHTEVSEIVGEIDCNTWHPLHKWIIKLYAMSSWLVSHSLDTTVLEQATKLQKGLAKYVKTFSTKAEFVWIHGLRRGELLQAGESYIKEEFSPHTESVELLLFQPETSEQQFRFYLKQINGRLEGYKECFDWLLSAEEFHSESDWLECMRNHAVQISDVPHAQKMIDIIYMQRQLLCSCKESTDIVYMDMKQILLHLFSTFPWFSQEEIIEYAFMMNLALKCSEETLFFHPHFTAQERESFQQDLIMVFNKLIDISSEDQLHLAVKEFARATLVSPQLTLNKAVHEGVKSVGHSEAICSVLRKLPTVCLLKCNESASPQTLLCCAVKSVTMSLTSRQEENNLLCMVSMMLSGSFESSPLLSVQEFLEAVVLPYLNNTNAQDDIPTVLALKLLSTSMAAVRATDPLHVNSISKHLLPIILCLCELLNESNVFWTCLAPVHSLSEMEEVRELVLKALDTVVELYSDVLGINHAFARGVEWLFNRLSSDFDWTVPLYLKKLFTSAHIQSKFPVPYSLLNVCEDMGEEWVADKHLAYGVEDVFTVLFEFCRISESALQRILESLVPNRLTDSFQDIRKHVVASLAQILPHCTWKEWKWILDMCRYLIRKNILKDSTQVIWCVQANNNEVCEISALLLDTLKALHSPLCSPWATPVVWLYIIKHYIMALKEIADKTTDVAVTAPVFAHVCHVMTIVPADCEDQLFVLALDLVARPSFMSDDITEHLKMSINNLTSEVYKATLLQKLNQNF